MSADTMELRAGDEVQLAPRKAPFHDDPSWWYEIVEWRDTGMDVRLWRGHRVVEFRRDVAHARIRGARRAGEA